MKKYSTLFLALALVLTTALSACTQTTAAVSTNSPSQLIATTKPSVNVTSPMPTTSTFSSINSKKIEFDAAINSYFDGDVEAALTKMEPLLTTASFAEYTYKTPFISSGSALDPTFSWYTIFWLLNTDDYKDSAVSRKSDGTFELTPATMKKVFASTFVAFSGTLPQVPSDLTGIITLDKNGNYLISVANGETITYQLKNITISKANSAADPTQSATLTIDVLDTDNKVLATVYIEVCHNKNSVFRYSIQSAEKAN